MQQTAGECTKKRDRMRGCDLQAIYPNAVRRVSHLTRPMQANPATRNTRDVTFEPAPNNLDYP
jgi:hypothetical protein